MNSTKTDNSENISARVRFVLVETYHPGNIGAVARAIKTMGFSDLVLVNPHEKNVKTHEEALAFASNANDILEKARIVSTLEEALENCGFAAALTARPRLFSPPVLTPRKLAKQISQENAAKTALIFGSERYGLPNEIVERCHVLINIPANPEYSSLNIAQAVQILAYECREAIIGDNIAKTNVGFKGRRASVEQIDKMYDHLEEALIAIKYLDPENPKMLKTRLRRLFAREGLEMQEINILRGIAKHMIFMAEENVKNKRTSLE